VCDYVAKPEGTLCNDGNLCTQVDLHIAATAIEAGATLVTNDRALLDGTLPGLTVENWLV